jgi:hypothetical protein
MEVNLEHKKYQRELNSLKGKIIKRIRYHLKFVTNGRIKFPAPIRVSENMDLWDNPIEAVSEGYIKYEKNSKKLEDALMEELILILYYIQ